MYHHIYPKYTNSHAQANSVDLHQTALKEWFDPCQYCLPLCQHLRHITS